MCSAINTIDTTLRCSAGRVSFRYLEPSCLKPAASSTAERNMQHYAATWNLNGWSLVSWFSCVERADGLHNCGGCLTCHHLRGKLHGQCFIAGKFNRRWWEKSSTLIVQSAFSETVVALIQLSTRAYCNGGQTNRDFGQLCNQPFEWKVDQGLQVWQAVCGLRTLKLDEYCILKAAIMERGKLAPNLGNHCSLVGSG